MIQPSAGEERKEALRSRARGWLRDKVISPAQCDAIETHARSGWRRVGLILHIVFFVLTLNVLGAVFGISALLDLPKGVVTATVAIAAAEVLILRLKFFGTGIESALWMGGLFALIFGLPSQGKVEALLVFAAAAAIAGWRVRQPLFGGLAVVLVAAYVGVKIEAWWAALLFCAVVTLGALVILGRELARRSTNALHQVLLIVMPLTGYIAAKLRSEHMTTVWPLAAAMLVLGAIVLGAGFRRRGRVELMAGFVSIALGVAELQLDLSWAIETKLIAAGLLFIALAFLVWSALRHRSRGFVVTPSSRTRYDEAMQIAATIALAPPHQPAAAAGHRESGGGSFGGAGSSGDF